MPDNDEENYEVPQRKCNVTVKGTDAYEISLPASHTWIQPSEAIFDTGATGTINIWAPALTDIATCSPTLFKGLHGSLTVTKARQLRDIGLVHFDVRAAMSIVSASDIIQRGHTWKFKRGSDVNTDAFLEHTQKSTYRFQHRDVLYLCDLAREPEPRHMNAIMPRISSPRPTIVMTPKIIMLYTTKQDTPNER